MSPKDKLRQLIATQPFLGFLGIELIDAGEGWVRERLPTRPEFFQPYVVHGGAIYALADTNAAHAALTVVLPDGWVTTVEQKINFLRPVRAGALIGTGRVLHQGRRVIYAESEIHNDDGELVARSTATLMRIAEPGR